MARFSFFECFEVMETDMGYTHMAQELAEVDRDTVFAVQMRRQASQ